MGKFKIALVGNTNAGKTTFLNTICGLSQETSNYPGTTVELFKAKVEYKKIQYQIVDLPGTYSLAPFSDEEKVARKILQEEKFDLVVQIIEPAFKKRSLAFTLELMELGLPLFIVINNKNNTQKQTDHLLNDLEKELSISSISINALKKETKNLFFEKIQKQKTDPEKYQKALDQIHHSLNKEIKNLQEKFKINNLWIALKILENDQEIINKYIKNKDLNKIYNQLKNTDYNLKIKNNRFNFIEHHLLKYSKPEKHNQQHLNCHKNKSTSSHFISDKIDHILLNKWFGIPIFLFLMWLVFQATFTFGAIPISWIDNSIKLLQENFRNLLPNNLWSSALIDGAIGGVGATLVFLPPIMLLFFFLSLFQQSGYLTRIAYLLNNLMSKIGLGGKSFMPLLIGFGCNVPAIMATKTLTSKKERIITAMMIPFMSCGTKLPIYTLFISAFFAQQYRSSVLFIIYIFGILMGIFSGSIFNRIIKERKMSFFLELPAYTMPKLKNVWQSIWRETKRFLYKAGKIILPFSIILWFLFSFPMINNKSVNIEKSYAANIGKFIEPIFKPLGFDWRISTGLIAGLGAKEVFISTFGTIYSLDKKDQEGLILKLQNDPIFTLPTVISLLVFILIYTPCIAVISVIKQEFGWKLAMIEFIYPILLAWILSFLIYKISSIFYTSS